MVLGSLWGESYRSVSFLIGWTGLEISTGVVVVGAFQVLLVA